MQHINSRFSSPSYGVYTVSEETVLNQLDEAVMNEIQFQYKSTSPLHRDSMRSVPVKTMKQRFESAPSDLDWFLDVDDEHDQVHEECMESLDSILNKECNVWRKSKKVVAPILTDLVTVYKKGRRHDTKKTQKLGGGHPELPSKKDLGSPNPSPSCGDLPSPSAAHPFNSSQHSIEELAVLSLKRAFEEGRTGSMTACDLYHASVFTGLDSEHNKGKTYLFDVLSLLQAAEEEVSESPQRGIGLIRACCAEEIVRVCELGARAPPSTPTTFAQSRAVADLTRMNKLVSPTTSTLSRSTLSSCVVVPASGSDSRECVKALAIGGRAVTAAARVALGVLPEGVKCVTGVDAMQPQTLTGLFTGVDYSIIFAPRVRTGVAADREASLNLLRAAVAQKSKHIVFINSWMYKLKNSTIGDAYQASEDFLESQTTVKWTILRGGWQMKELLREAGHVRCDSTYRGNPITFGIPYVHPRDVGRSAAGVILGGAGKYEGAVFDITGPERLTQAQIADSLTKVLGRPITVGEVCDPQGTLEASIYKEVEKCGEKLFPPTDHALKLSGKQSSLSEWLAEHLDSFCENCAILPGCSEIGEACIRELSQHSPNVSILSTFLSKNSERAARVLHEHITVADGSDYNAILANKNFVVIEVGQYSYEECDSILDTLHVLRTPHIIMISDWQATLSPQTEYSRKLQLLEGKLQSLSHSNWTVLRRGIPTSILLQFSSIQEESLLHWGGGRGAPLVDLRDIGKIVACLITNRIRFTNNEKLDLTGPALLTPERFASLLKQMIARDIKVLPMSEQHTPAELLILNDHSLNDNVSKLLGKANSIEAWIQENMLAFTSEAHAAVQFMKQASPYLSAVMALNTL